MIISNCRRIVGGTGEGKTLVTMQPINFLAMINAKTGTITDPLPRAARQVTQRIGAHTSICHWKQCRCICNLLVERIWECSKRSCVFQSGYYDRLWLCPSRNPGCRPARWNTNIYIKAGVEGKGRG